MEGNNKPEELWNFPAWRDLLTEYFNISELQDLCFDLKIDFDNLPGQSKRDKARELLGYMQRDDRSD